MTPDISDLSSTIIPKSDQLNADQLLAGPMIIRVSDVEATTAPDQPVIVHYSGENGRPYKPCKTMRKVLILAWGPDGRNWIGKSLELYNEPTVKWGGVDVGGIRISRLSDIPGDIRVSLAATKGKKALHEIKPLPVRPARTERHDKMVSDFEALVQRDGLEAFVAAWSKLEKADRAAIGVSERDRIAAMAQPAGDSSTTEGDHVD